MAIIFLIGGTGNQLFQIATSDKKDVFSLVINNRFFGRVLGWTTHEQVLKIESSYNALAIFALGLVASDILIYKIFKNTLFSELDLMSIKSKPLIKRVVALGYFQEKKITRDVNDLVELDYHPDKLECVMHIRGGDLIKNIQSSQQNKYGVLTSDYYRKALNSFNIPSNQTVTILTDDVSYAERLVDDIKNYNFDIKKISLSETISKSVFANNYISSNSTLSYWVVVLRGEKASIAPLPFMKDSLPMSSKVMRIDV